MARIPIWLLAAVAAVSLVNAVPVSGDDEKSLYGGEVFYNLRIHLDLNRVPGSSDFVGLHTLLDGAHLEYRKITWDFLTYLNPVDSSQRAERDYLETNYPDRFQTYFRRKVVIPSFVNEWFDTDFNHRGVLLSEAKHSLANLGLNPDVDHIVDVVTALFEALDSPKLLENFRTITTQSFPTLQDGRAVDWTVQASQLAQLKPTTFRAFMHRFWLDVIGGNDEHQLRYFLCNMLAYDVIPHMLAQVLQSGKYAEAVKLAKQISKTLGVSEIPGSTKEDKPNPKDTPDYFEFIV
ncbi:hypothetical protein H4R34_005404, partial [Dimargaris verticillata]